MTGRWMGTRGRLFASSDIYDIEGTKELFLAAVRENCLYHYSHCGEYQKILDYYGFCPEDIRRYEDIAKIPFLPTLFFKRHAIFSMPPGQIRVKAFSSGTSGAASCIGFDSQALALGFYMGLKTAARNGLCTMRPANYLIFGYKPHKNNRTGVAKTTYLSTYFAPARKRTYALLPGNRGYYLDMEGVIRELIRCGKSRFPVRIMGFPSYAFFALKLMEERGMRLTFPKGSKIILSGGWKQHQAEEVDKQVLYDMSGEIWGIGEDNIREFFSAMEHPVLYCGCKNHHFHIPVYSRVIIRDVNTLKPAGYGQMGLVNLITPMIKATPVLSVMTDDLGILHEGHDCGCGITSPYLELKGRAGLKGIKTCAAGAALVLDGMTDRTGR